jgi:hypothetical protein
MEAIIDDGFSQIKKELDDDQKKKFDAEKVAEATEYA